MSVGIYTTKSVLMGGGAEWAKWLVANFVVTMHGETSEIITLDKEEFGEAISQQYGMIETEFDGVQNFRELFEDDIKEMNEVLVDGNTHDIIINW